MAERVSQVVVEALIKPVPKARVSQLVVEVLVQNVPPPQGGGGKAILVE